MAIQQKNAQLSYDPRSNFGFKGWWIIIFAAMNFWVYGNLNSAGLNVITPNRAAELGADQGIVQTLGTPAGIIGMLLLVIVFQPFLKKVGVRIAGSINLILFAGSIVYWALAPNLPNYIIAIILAFFFMNNMQYAECTVLVTNWFPKKKGIAMGWATMGLNLSSLVIVTIMTNIVAKYGSIKYAMFGMAGICVILAIINFFGIRNFPEEWGGYPDNNKNAVREDGLSGTKTGWTTRKVLKQKETWMMGLGIGLYSAGGIGFLSSLVTAMSMKGFEVPTALLMMTIASACGLLGSYICGWLDQKFGTQKALLIYGVWILIASLLYLIPGHAVAWIHVIMFGLAIGGCNNYPPSMCAQVFGRHGSLVAYPVVNFMCAIFMYMPHFLLGICLTLTGTYTIAWIIFAVFVVIGMILFYLVDLNPKQDPIELEKASEQKA